jgi:hypothetical protein
MLTRFCNYTPIYEVCFQHRYTFHKTTHAVRFAIFAEKRITIYPPFYKDCVPLELSPTDYHFAFAVIVAGVASNTRTGPSKPDGSNGESAW